MVVAAAGAFAVFYVHAFASCADFSAAAVTFDVTGTIASGTATLTGSDCPAPTGSGPYTGAIVIRGTAGATGTTGFCRSAYIGGKDYATAGTDDLNGRLRYARVEADAPTATTPKVRVYLSSGESRVTPKVRVRSRPACLGEGLHFRAGHRTVHSPLSPFLVL